MALVVYTSDMSKRLQVLMDEEELREIKEIARRKHMSVA